MKWFLFLVTVIIAIVVVAVQVWSLGRGVGPAEECVERFMAAGQARDVDAASEIFVGMGQSKSAISTFIDGNYDAFFARYKDVRASGWKVDAEKQQSLNVSLSVISGVIVYSDGATVSFNAGLAKYEGAWKIWAITIGGKELR